MAEPTNMEEKLAGIVVAFKECIDTEEKAEGEVTNSIDLMKFVTAARSLAIVYDALFMGVVAKQLKHDIINSSNTIEKAFLLNPEHDTLQKLMAYEVATYTVEGVRKNKEKKCGSIGILWAKRAVEFISTYLGFLVEHKELKSGECASKTYALVLKQYHGWMVGGIVGTAIGMAPSRESIYQKFGITGTQAEMDTKIRSVSDAMGVVVVEIQRMLNEHGTDFPDKV